MLLTFAFVCFAMLVLAWVFLPAEPSSALPVIVEERVSEQTVPA